MHEPRREEMSFFQGYAWFSVNKKIPGIVPEFKFTVLIAAHEFESWETMQIVVDSH